MPMTPGQMSRLLPKASVEGTRKVLNRLTRQGIVRSTHVGDAAVTYELNRSHVAADAIIELANQVQAVHRRIQDLLASWDPTPVYAALFGSWARAEATADSDVDLFLVRPADADDARWEEQVDALRISVSRWTGNDARPFVVDALELPFRRDEPVLRSIRSEGVPVFGDATWFRQQILLRVPARANKESV